MNWKPSSHRNIPAKAIITTRSPPEGEEDTEHEYSGRQSHTLPRASARRSVGLRPLGRGGMPSPSSPQYRPRNLSAERPSPRQAVPNSLRSRSPSPPGQHQAVRVGSRSPSPGVHHSPGTSPMLRRKQPPQTSHTHTLQPPGKQILIKSPSAPGLRKLLPPTSGSSPGSKARVPQTSSAPSPGQRLVSPAKKHPSSAPQPQRQQVNNSTFLSPQKGPRTQNSPQRGPRTQMSPQRAPQGQTTPPRSTPGSQIRPARHSATPPSRLVRPLPVFHGANSPQNM